MIGRIHTSEVEGMRGKACLFFLNGCAVSDSNELI